ncbi:hypothetical protein ACIBCT_35320 [Streptosporangium sp. NPDC050855]|uniref:hypothetical protein n=1 Tax=Streptosporangium sp. NPDC050855 TaxID=3366194 RepID=UPI0037AA8A19
MPERRKATTKYTLVQHSGSTSHAEFRHAVEVLSVSTLTEQDKIEKVGGLLFESWEEADNREYEENYPPGVTGLYPRVPGTFRTDLKIDGFNLYIPAAKNDTEGQ